MYKMLIAVLVNLKIVFLIVLKLSSREHDLFLCLLQGISRGKYSGIWQALRLVYKEEGFASLW